MGVAWSQVFPGNPEFTEKDLDNQQGKVFIVTGGYSGVGHALSEILYGAGGTVYIAGRSEEKARDAIVKIRSRTTTQNSMHGKLEFLLVDFSNFESIKPAVEKFCSAETRLDVLFNNAATNFVPAGTLSPQGQELTMATNCQGPLLFTLHLLSILRLTASEALPGDVRVVWTSSQVVDFSPNEGLQPTDWLDPPSDKNRRYQNSKTGNWFLASEFAKRFAIPAKILSITQNPGALKTNLLRDGHWLIPYIVSPLLSPAINGAYTELYCGLSPDLNVEQHSGGYVIPWGRLHPSLRPDLLNALKSKDKGGNGRAAEYWDWCIDVISPYLQGVNMQ